jgi:hypothetical protein
MHGLINKAVQCFVRDTYGAPVWAAVARTAGLGEQGFEAMLDYPDALTGALIDAAAAVLARPRETVLEDLGTYLVSHPNTGPLRRLLRFGGVDFADFVLSLDELPDRGRLALPDLDLPDLRLEDHGGGRFTLTCTSPVAGAGHVVVGLLRAMADDYGALAWLEHEGSGADGESIAIALCDPAHAEGRGFELSARGG